MVAMHTGHSPQLITATIQQACLVFQFVRLLRQAYGLAGTKVLSSKQKTVFTQANLKVMPPIN
jgi:hypothetical protein